MKTYLFDDRNSFIHALLGFIFVLFPLIGLIGWPVFVYYEWQEFEDPVATIGDIWEAGIGAFEALFLHYALHIGPFLVP